MALPEHLAEVQRIIRDSYPDRPHLASRCGPDELRRLHDEGFTTAEAFLDVREDMLLEMGFKKALAAALVAGGPLLTHPIGRSTCMTFRFA